jgi:hypothetical protein
VLITCTLINMMLLPLPLGLCFVHILLQIVINSHTYKCIILSCTRSEKDYKCYSPTLCHYLVLANVTFFDSVPLTSKSALLLVLLLCLLAVTIDSHHPELSHVPEEPPPNILGGCTHTIHLLLHHRLVMGMPLSSESNCSNTTNLALPLKFHLPIGLQKGLCSR